MKKIIFSLLALLWAFGAFSQAPTFTANTFNPPDTAHFCYGINSGYLSKYWPDTASSHLQRILGAHSTRTFNFAYAEVPLGKRWAKPTYDFNANQNHFYNNTICLNGVYGPDADNTVYTIPTRTSSGANLPSQMFAGIYNPIWNSDGTPDTANNTFAKYVWDIVSGYGSTFHYYEIWNEPDISSGNGVNIASGQPGSWWQNMPPPQDIYNLRCPITHYIRCLRIAYEIIHKYNPGAKVVTGGIGFPVFLDQLCRYTDNPGSAGDGDVLKGAGSVTPAYPITGGGYIDMLSFHNYPFYSLSVYNNTTSRHDYRRNSDTAIAILKQFFQGFQTVLANRGYGTTYPAKQFMLTETDGGHASVWNNPNLYGAGDVQRNFTMKVLAVLQQLGVVQAYDYQIADEVPLPDNSNDPDPIASVMGKFYFVDSIKNTNYSACKLAPAGIGRITQSGLLFGYYYDSVKTKAINLNTNISVGLAFTKPALGSTPAQTRYMLWTYQHRDKVEYDTSVITFPTGVTVSKVWNWDACLNRATGQPYPYPSQYISSNFTGNTIKVSGTPVIVQ